MSAVINLQKMVEEMDLYSAESHGYLNIQTGEFFHFSEEEINAVKTNTSLEKFPAWQQEILKQARRALTDEAYLALPTQYDIHEYKIMQAFCEVVEDEKIRAKLFEGIRGRGAFRNFKNIVLANDLFNVWQAYRLQALKKIAKEWLDRHQLVYTESNL